MSAAAAEVDELRGTAVAQIFKREQVGRRQVFDVDVVTDGRAVLRRVVAPVDRNGRPARGRREDVRDEVRLRVVALSKVPSSTTYRFRGLRPCLTTMRMRRRR